MIKLLYVISDGNIGGAGVLLCNILRHLDRRAFCTAVALPYGSALRERILALRCRVYELERPCDRLCAASVCELVRVIRAEQPDIVHANAALSARVAGRLYGCRVVHTRHCYYPIAKPQGIVGSVKCLANRCLSDRAIATAEPAAKNLRRLGIPRKRICVIPNGSDPVRQVSKEELDAWREKLSLSETDYCVGICARLVPCKGHDCFLRAAALAAARMPEQSFRFLIVGEGEARAALEARARLLGITEQVRFVGFVSDVAPIYRLLRIHVNCSQGTETSCLAISEGMSAGLPTLASDYGGNPAMLAGSGAGRCFPVGDFEALAGEICRIASSKDTERKMSHAARQRYQAAFTAKGMVKKLERVYQNIL